MNPFYEIYNTNQYEHQKLFAHFCEKYINPLGSWFIDYININGYIWPLFASSIAYTVMMIIIFYVRRFVTGNHNTNLITEFANNKILNETPHTKIIKKRKITNFTKCIIFGWNIFMVFISYTLLAIIYDAHLANGVLSNINVFTIDGYIVSSLSLNECCASAYTTNPYIERLKFNGTNINYERIASSKNIYYHQLMPSDAIFNFLIASKFLEWIDTALNIAIGNPVILLHFWHHATIVASFSIGRFSSAGMTVLLFNSFIHIIMYLYYAFSVISYVRPLLNPFKIVITSLQITQFICAIIAGFIHLIPAYHDIAQKFYNPTTGPVIGNTFNYHLMTEFFVVSNLILFLNFFVKIYITKKPLKND